MPTKYLRQQDPLSLPTSIPLLGAAAQLLWRASRLAQILSSDPMQWMPTNNDADKILMTTRTAVSFDVCLVVGRRCAAALESEQTCSNSQPNNTTRTCHCKSLFHLPIFNMLPMCILFFNTRTFIPTQQSTTSKANVMASSCHCRHWLQCNNQ